MKKQSPGDIAQNSSSALMVKALGISERKFILRKITGCLPEVLLEIVSWALFLWGFFIFILFLGYLTTSWEWWFSMFASIFSVTLIFVSSLTDCVFFYCLTFIICACICFQSLKSEISKLNFIFVTCHIFQRENEGFVRRMIKKKKKNR